MLTFKKWCYFTTFPCQSHIIHSLCSVNHNKFLTLSTADCQLHQPSHLASFILQSLKSSSVHCTVSCANFNFLSTVLFRSLTNREADWLHYALCGLPFHSSLPLSGTLLVTAQLHRTKICRMQQSFCRVLKQARTCIFIMESLF